MIKFLDLHKINARFEIQFQKEFQNFLNSGQYVLSERLLQFENNFATYCGSKYCLGISNGLDALTLILKGYQALGRLKKGDDVIVPANTYIASILAIINTGLKPVLVEPNPDTFNSSISEIEKHITKNTRAIMAVHLYGQLAKMDSINGLAKKHNLLVIEDAAQAHGAQNEIGKKAGNLSNAAAFSFYPAKNLGALGDAGAITTNDIQLYEVVRNLRNYGSEKKYVYELLGVNNRMDELQAVFLDIKLKQLDKDNEKRRSIAIRYLNEVINPKIKLPYYDNSKNHVFHLFVVRVRKRDSFINYMERYGIQTLIHYPIPPHKQKALSKFISLELPITESIHATVVSLPLSPVMSDNEVDYVIKTLNAY